MGFFTDLILGEKCEYCGSRSVEDYNSFPDSRGTIRLKWCRSCKCVSVDESGYVPRCYRCGTPQTFTGKNEYGTIVPQCPKCEYLWDGDDYNDRM